jgi:hypothetical protein
VLDRDTFSRREYQQALRERERMEVRDEALRQVDAIGGGGVGTVLYANLAGAFTAPQTASFAVADTFGLHVYPCNCSAGAIVVTLPSAVANEATLVFKKTDATANTLTLDAPGAETIDGGGTAVILVQYAAVTLVSDGTQWLII